MPIPFGLIASLAAPAIGGLFGDRSREEQTRNESFNRDESFNRSGTSSAAPVFNTEALPLAGASLESALAGLNAPINFDTAALDNLQLQQGGQINAAYEGAERNLAASLASRGLQNSPGVQAVSQANLQGSRAGDFSRVASDIAQQKFNLPLLQDQIRQNRLNSALQALQLFRGETSTENITGSNKTTGTSKSTGTSTGMGGGGLSGALGGFAEGLAFNAGNKLPKLIGGGNLGDYVTPGLPDISKAPLAIPR